MEVVQAKPAAQSKMPALALTLAYWDNPLYQRVAVHWPSAVHYMHMAVGSVREAVELAAWFSVEEDPANYRDYVDADVRLMSNLAHTVRNRKE